MQQGAASCVHRVLLEDGLWKTDKSLKGKAGVMQVQARRAERSFAFMEDKC